MRQTLLTAAAAVLFAGAFVWHAEAAPWSGAAKIGAAAKDASVVESVGCDGRWHRCRPGWFWAHGRCRPC
jgi:hypothetical protein